MPMAEGSRERRWTVVQSLETRMVLEELKTTDPAQRAFIFGQIDAMSQMVEDLTVGELERALRARFKYKPLKGEARGEHLFQIDIGRSNLYRAAILRLDADGQFLIIHIYSKNQQTKGITRAVAIARERRTHAN